MKAEGVFGNGFRQEIGVLVFLLYVRDGKLSLLDVLSQEVVAYVDVFRVRVGHRVHHLDGTLVVLKTWAHGSQNPGHRKRHTYRIKGTLVKPSVIATCSASIEECMVHLCVLEIDWVAAPLHVMATPETNNLFAYLGA